MGIKRRHIECPGCGKHMSVLGAWPDEYMPCHKSDHTGSECDESGRYLLPGTTSREREQYVDA